MTSHWFLAVSAVMAALPTLVSCSLSGRLSNVALLVVDVQDCFLDSRSPLHVVGGANVVPGVNDVIQRHGDAVTCVVFVQDLHCVDHVAFASQHPGRKAFESVTLLYDQNGTLCSQPNLTSAHAQPCHHVTHHVTQILWPDHCIVGSAEADLAAGLLRHEEDIVIKTGNNCHVDTYSAFKDNGGLVDTGLNAILRRRDVGIVLVTGVALQYSVYNTLLDSLIYGYKTYLVLDATAGASGADKQSTERKMKELREKGVNIVNITELEEEVFKPLGQASKGHGLLHYTIPLYVLPGTICLLALTSVL